MTEAKSSKRKIARRGKILYSLVLLMLLAGLVPLLLTSAELIDRGREALGMAEKSLQLDQTRSLAQQARLYLQAMHNQILSIAQTFAVGGDPRAVASRIASVLTSQELINYVQEESHILSLTVYDHRGRYLTAGVSLDETVLEEFRRQSALEALSGRAWVSPPHVSEPLLDTVVLIAAPIFTSISEGAYPRQVAGGVSAMISLQPIQEMVEAKASRGREVYIINGAGQLVAHSDRETLFTRRDLSDSVMFNAFRASTRQASETVNFNRGGDESQAMLGTFTPIGDRGSLVPFLRELDWGAIVQAEEEAFYYNVREMERASYLVAALFAALGVLLAVAFAGRLSQPIAHLADGARRLAEGDFSQNIRVSSRNEIGELADTFNIMQDEIRSFIEQLRRAAEENKEMFMGFVRSITAAVDAKNPYTAEHSERVSHYAEMIAKKMGFPDDELEVLRIGALMHDVGKIGIEDEILNKEGPLSKEQYGIMKTHPMKGAVIMEKVRQLERMIPPMKSHHENVDGSGYPDGLKGNEIPLAAKIVGVADTFDAMTTDRPYQKAMETSHVFERMRSFVGKKFDAEIVEALIAAYEEGLIRPPSSASAVERAGAPTEKGREERVTEPVDAAAAGFARSTN